jgi:hypothetical protein
MQPRQSLQRVQERFLQLQLPRREFGATITSSRWSSVGCPIEQPFRTKNLIRGRKNLVAHTVTGVEALEI